MDIRNENTEIRGRGKKTRFYVDNEILELYGPILKPHGIALYVALARHANSNTQICFPSYERLIRCSGIGNRNTISKKLQLLEDIGLIRIKHSNGRGSNYYKLLHVGPRGSNSIGKAQQQYQYRTYNSSKRDTGIQSIKSKKEINPLLERVDTNTKCESTSDILERKYPMLFGLKKEANNPQE